MYYSSLAELYENLESTSLKLKKTRILAEFLENTPQNEIEHIILLCRGRVFPEWSEKELGIASLLMVRTLSKSYGVPEKKISDAWRETGDLGLVAEEFSSKKRQKVLFAPKLNVDKVVSNLQKAAELSGTKSQERKMGLIGELLSSAGPKEAKYLARIVIGDLRIGVAEGLLRDAIAGAFFADVRWSALLSAKTNKKKLYEHIFEGAASKKIIFEDTLYNSIKKENEKLLASLESKNTVEVKTANEISSIPSFWKKEAGIDFVFVSEAELGNELRSRINGLIEKAHALTNDYALVAKTALEEGNAGLSKLSLVMFRPIKVMLAQKADGIDDAFETVERPAAIEYKFDGFRMQIHKDGEEVQIYTRRLENVTAQFPEVAIAVKKALLAKSCIVEGEAIGIDKETGKWLPFQKLSRRIRRKYDINKLAKEIPVRLNLFDILYLNGNVLIEKPFVERRGVLKDNVREIPGNVVLADQIVTDEATKANDFYQEALSLGNEGVMFKNLSAEYKPGSRVGYMLKLKPVMESLDLTIVGAEWGEGKRAGWLSSFVLACRDETGNFLSIGRLGTGIKEKAEEGTSFKELTEHLKPHIIREEGKHVDITPTLTLEVAYEEIQKSPSYDSGYALRFPRLVRLRPDKSISDADGLERVESLFMNQKHKVVTDK